LIEVRGLTKKYGDNTVVNGISFVIESGKIYGFLGPNGAGKSTTMNMITGCLAPTDGEILVDGISIFDDPIGDKRKVGYLPENPPVYPDMTPEEYLTFVASAKGLRGRELNEQVISVMDETNILPMKDRLIKNLSKGYRQRVGIAQAMLGDPQVIILDEPTVGLDPKQITEIRELIAELGKTRTVILSSHILAEVSAVCDEVMIINRGKLIASDTLENIRRENSPENSIVLTVRAEDNAIVSLLDSFGDEIVDYVITDSSEEGCLDVSIEAATDADIREELYFALARQGIAVRRLAKHAPSLEEIFLSLTDVVYGNDGDDEEYDEDTEDEDSENEDEYDDVDDDDDDDDDESDDDGDYKSLFSAPAEEDE
jgi:ABC-2 type transport system ATP-binding protein